MQQQSLKCPSRNTTNLPQIYPTLHPTVLIKPEISEFISGVSRLRIPEFPGLYPEFPPKYPKPGVSGLIPGVSGLDSIFAPKTEILIFGKTTPPNLKP